MLSNPTALPQDYRRNLGWLLVTVLMVTGVAAIAEWWRRGRD